ncbi:MAG: PAS domain-containing protein [Deltaproteobacteria bacterium]|nr:PAS domain-containing protein [Deltaproteobacteria bacterium]
MSPLDFEAVFDASPNAYMLVDRDLRYVAANRAYLAVTGATLDDLIGQLLLERFPNDPDDPNNASAQQLRKSLERVLATGEPDALPFIRYRVEGAEEPDAFWSATHTPVLGPSGKPEYVLQHTMNVTRLKDAVDPARLEEVIAPAQMVQQAFRVLDDGVETAALLEQSPGFMAFLDGPDHVFRRTNEAYRRLIGGRDVLGRPIGTALPELHGQGFVEILDEVFRSGEAHRGRGALVRLRDANGELRERYVDFVYQPIRADQGGVTGIFVQGSDVTEREHALVAAQEARRLAENASRLRDEFLATVSHELRTPLNAMLGWLGLLRSGSLPEADGERALETIDRNARSQLRLVEDLLDVGSILSGKFRMRQERVRPEEIVQAAVDTARPAASSKGITITVDLESKSMVLGDSQRLQQVAWNLLSNAVKFTPRNGKVVVGVHREEDMVRISVADDGPGIADEFKAHAFDRFRQQDAELNRRAGGLGLGLAIAKHLVELHGGTIGVVDAPGGGALFEVRLPLATGDDARESVVSWDLTEQPAELQGLKVLLVEDDADTRDFVVVVLRRAGCDVITALSASEALRVLQTDRPDMIVSDIAMPDMSGLDFIRAVRRLPPTEGGQTLALTLTAQAAPKDRARALRAGFQNHVPKPVAPIELVEAIAALARWGK